MATSRRNFIKITVLGLGGATVATSEAQFLKLMKDESITFVDLRNSQVFIKGHIDGAINVPVHLLVNNEYTELFAQEGKRFYFYGDRAWQAVSP